MEKDHSNYGVGIIRSGQAVPGLFPLGVVVLGMAAWFMEKDYNGVKARVVAYPSRLRCKTIWWAQITDVPRPLHNDALVKLAL